MAGVIEGFIGHAASQRAVANDADHAGVLTPEGPGTGHTQRRGDRHGGVAADVGVVHALIRARESAEPLELPQCRKPVSAASEHFVDIALVANVVDDLVFGRLIDAIDGSGDLHDA